MKNRFKISGFPALLALGLMALIALALLGFSQREAIVTQVVGDGYLHGLLVDEEGHPVAEVPVTLVVQRASGINCSGKECDLFNAPVFQGREITDTQGNFSIHVPRRYLAEREKPSLYLYKLQVEVTPLKIKLFYNLNLASHEANEQIFKLKPPFWTG